MKRLSLISLLSVACLSTGFLLEAKAEPPYSTLDGRTLGGCADGVCRVRTSRQPSFSSCQSTCQPAGLVTSVERCTVNTTRCGFQVVRRTGNGVVRFLSRIFN